MAPFASCAVFLLLLVSNAFGVIYVAPTGGSAGPACGSTVTPCATLGDGFLAVTTNERTIILQAGTHTVASSTLTAQFPVIVDGQGQTVSGAFALTLASPITFINITTGGQSVFTVQSANTFDGCTFSGVDQITASGTAELTVSRSKFTVTGVDYVVKAFEGSAVVIEGSTFTDASVTEGVVVLSEDASLAVSGSTFTNNVNTAEGGAITGQGLSAQSIVTVDSSTFANNTARYGGAIDFKSSNRIRITASTFSGNSALAGGAVSIRASVSSAGTDAVLIDGSTFTANTATGSTGIYTSGGAIFAAVPVNLRDNRFAQNVAALHGGALYAQHDSLLQNNEFFTNAATTGNGGAAAFSFAATPMVVGSEFEANTAGHSGGAVWTASDQLEITQSSFTSNGATQSGGALYAAHTVATVSSATFTQNSASVSGGAIFTSGRLSGEGNSFSQNTATVDGGAIFCESNTAGASAMTVALVSSTFANNTAGDDGGAIFTELCHVTLNKSAFKFNSAADHGGAVYATTVVALTGATIESNQAATGGALYSASAEHVTLSAVTATNNVASGTQGGSLFLDRVTKLDLDTIVLSGSTPDDLVLISTTDVLVTGASTLGSVYVDFANNAKLVLDGPENHLFQFHHFTLVRGVISVDSNVGISGNFSWHTGSFAAANLPTGRATLSISLDSTSHAMLHRNSSNSFILSGVNIYPGGEFSVSEYSMAWDITSYPDATAEPSRTCLVLSNGASFNSTGTSQVSLGLNCVILTDTPRHSYFVSGGGLHIEKHTTISVPFRALNNTGTLSLYVRSITPVDHDVLDLTTKDNVVGGHLRVVALPSVTGVDSSTKFASQVISAPPAGFPPTLVGNFTTTTEGFDESVYGLVQIYPSNASLILDETLRPDPNSGNVATGIILAIVIVAFLVAVFFFVKPFLPCFKKKKGEDSDEEGGDEEAGKEGSKEKKSPSEGTGDEVEKALLKKDQEEKKPKKPKKTENEAEMDVIAEGTKAETPKKRKKPASAATAEAPADNAEKLPSKTKDKGKTKEAPVVKVDTKDESSSDEKPKESSPKKKKSSAPKDNE